MKQIPKKQFDELVRLSRDVWENDNLVVLKERIGVAREITSAVGLDWLALIDFVDSVIRTSGFMPGADDETLYRLLGALGWEVAENVEEHPAN
jgi:hypothetical protein